MLPEIKSLSLVGTIVTAAIAGFLQVYLAVTSGLTPDARTHTLWISLGLTVVAAVAAICLAWCDNKLYHQGQKLAIETDSSLATLNSLLQKNLVAPGTLVYRALRLVSDLNAIVEPFLQKESPFRSQLFALDQLRQHPGAEEQYVARYGVSRKDASERIYAIERDAVRSFREGKYQDELQEVVRGFAAEGVEDEYLSVWAGMRVEEPWTVRNYRDGLNRLVAAYASRH